MRDQKINKQGSILLEALLSVVILSVSMTLIIQSMTSSLRAASYSADYTKAIFLAENKMFEIIQKGQFPSGKYEESTFDPPFEQYKSLLTTTRLTDESTEDLNKLDLDISWTSGKKDNHLNIETYVFYVP